MITNLETTTESEVQRSNPVFKGLSYVYQTTNETGRYLLELGKLEVEYTLLSIKIATLGLTRKRNK